MTFLLPASIPSRSPRRYRIINDPVEQFCQDYTGQKFHALLCDPPYHLTTITKRFGGTNSAPAKFGKDGAFSRASRGFMGQTWDGGDVAFDPDTWAMLGEHLYPGAFGMAFASSRGWHRLAVAIEDGGFIIHPSIFGWGFGSGFPKATRIDTQIDNGGNRIGGSIVELKQRLIEAVKTSGKTKKQIDIECGFRAANYLTLPKEGKRPDPWIHTLPTQEKWEVMKRAIGCGNSLDGLFARVQREVIGYQTKARSTDSSFALPTVGAATEYKTWDITTPATDLAKAWEGHRYGLQALKPALEPIIVFQKPYEGRPVDCITSTGAGAIWIDGGRISSGDEYQLTARINDHRLAGPSAYMSAGSDELKSGFAPDDTGRWPANFVLVHDPRCNGSCVPECAVRRLGEQSGIRSAGGNIVNAPSEPATNVYSGRFNRVQWQGHEDEGTASRFFHNADWHYEVAEQIDLADPVRYVAKASTEERSLGLENLPLQTVGDGRQTPIDNAYQRGETERRNPHPTVKPIALTEWLARLLLPPAAYGPRRLLVPFSGSGSEMIGALLAGWEQIVGIEMSTEYSQIARARLKYYADPLRAMRGTAQEEAPAPAQMEMFSLV